ncbi:MAG: beta-glucosidase [Clostridia bacterium]|nr:beta-glucosidase [Clostridia bacterium]
MNDMTIDFPLGVSSAAFQIEGAWNEDGKSESIWDRWLHLPGNGKASGDVAADHYHHMEGDLKLLKEMGVDSYRFSISWPRVLPEGKGNLNPKGMDFYRRILGRLKEYGISPAVTLYHWDLPQALQYLGGWANRDTCLYFQEYAEKMFDAFGSSVDIWITHNEPYVAAFSGHAAGRFAPGHRDFAEALQVSHHLLVSHGLAVASFRQANLKGKIGITLDYFPASPATAQKEDVLAARRDREHHLCWFADPVFKGVYPENMWNHYLRHGLPMPQMKADDLSVIAAPIDFLGINYYRPSVIQNCPGGNWPCDTAYLPNPAEKTESIYYHQAEKLYDYLKSLQAEYAPKEIIVTENGFSAYETPDRLGRIRDENRIDYLYRHLEKCVRAHQDGIPIGGYYVWSFLDDLEWTGGYAGRMGLVRVDYDTMKRTMKESGKWYQKMLKSRRLEAY